MTYGHKATIPILEDMVNNYQNPRDPTVCKYHGIAPKSDYLISYAVAKGDTLLSIARDTLGDPSRVGELINLNKEAYPHLSVSNPFLEVGWKIYLPPANFPPSSGNVSEIQGIISAIEKAQNPDSWEVQTDDPKISSPSYVTHISLGTFIDKPQRDYRVGDCVTIVAFSDTHYNPTMYLVRPQ